jgi:hypothetical protein
MLISIRPPTSLAFAFGDISSSRPTITVAWASDVKKYYSKFDVAVVAQMR